MTNEHDKNYREDEYHFPADDPSVGSNAAAEETTYQATDASGASSDEAVKEGVYNDGESDSSASMPEGPAQKIAAKLSPILASLKGMNFKNKKILVVGCGVIIALVIGSAVKTHHDENTTAAPTKTAKVAKVAAANPTSAQDQKIQSMTVQAVTDLRRSNQENQVAIQQLQQQFQSMQSAVTQVSSDESQLSAGLDNINQAIQGLNKKLDHEQAALKKTHKKVKPVVKAPVIKPLVYHLKALTSGRAWVQDSNGRSTSVKVGDNLPKYGYVSQIDIEDGFVKMNTGKTITYDETDG